MVKCSTATLGKHDKKLKNEKASLSDETVDERGLVKEKIKWKDITKEHASYCVASKDIKQFSGNVLGYVTPWNNHGYDTAKIFGGKFEFISPVWLQIHRKPGGQFTMGGAHDIDKGWMKDVKKDRHTKILPRILFEKWTSNDYRALFTDEDVVEDCISFILNFLKKNKFDGMVLEIWSSLGGTNRNELIHFINHVADFFHDAKKTFILVLPPPIYAGNNPGLISKANFDDFSDKIDGFSLMTYDYSSVINPGPNAPIDWVRKCVEILVPDDSGLRKKVLLGLNFYGYRYSNMGEVEAIVGSTYMETLKLKKPKLVWHEDHKEHSMIVKKDIGNDNVWFPSLKSIQERLDLARELNTGISIWEIGQGLDYFFDLL
ncbi:hypothetical protein LOTGIDRAFT_135362 [Lottia gigantea]|uniref:Chitinase domain-containing protein 1 n=1 Tax=Lottia gigantea TaxID=225164 RepID=V4B1J1_LOTGI|nr:hypothetical protein LOTGIDRAFT_135362 [Lottia gigantea]ESO82099.1 hypothetical protein LOTGIDRAFT_135362 [Lottia gigantea]